MDETPHTSMKQCFKCKQFKPATLEFFYSDRSRKDGLSPRCKPCKEIDRKPRYIPPEGYKHCPGCKNDLPATLEYFYPTSYQPNGLHSCCKKCAHDRRLEAWDRKLARKGKTRRPRRKGEGPDVEARKQYEKRWFQNGGNEIVKANTRNRRARLRQAEGKHTAKNVQEQYERQKGKCYWCSKKLTTYHVDHIIPIARGGTNWPDNLVIACPHCNITRNDRFPHEWPECGRLL